MSRTIRKTPYAGSTNKFLKRYSKRKARRNKEDLSDGGNYKRMTPYHAVKEYRPSDSSYNRDYRENPKPFHPVKEGTFHPVKMESERKKIKLGRVEPYVPELDYQEPQWTDQETWEAFANY